MTKTPALPAYIELRDEAAPMKFDGTEVVAAAAADVEDAVTSSSEVVEAVGE